MVQRIALRPAAFEELHPVADLQRIVRPSDLAPFDSTTEADHLRRLESDQELMLRIAAQGFDGEAWATLSTALARYGYAVIRAWIDTGLIISKCRSRGLGIEDVIAESPLVQDDVADLTQDVVGRALVSFRDRVLARGTWNAGRGASLATFFIGMCLIKFPNIWRSWRRATARLGESVQFDPEAHPHAKVPSPEDGLVSRDAGTAAVTAMLAPISDETNKTILKLVAEGYAIDEIAHLVDLTYKQVESRLYRTRRVLRTHLQNMKAIAHG